MKILVVDDSIVFRTSISQALNEVPGIDVFKTCSNGKIAVDIVSRTPDIDLVTLDLEMPVMDGIEAIKEIRKFNTNIKIIVFSSLTTSGAEKTIDALASGANDFLPKLVGMDTIEASLEAIKKELVPRINALVKKKTDFKKRRVSEETRIDEENNNIQSIVKSMPIKPKLITIGCSTGGPDALSTIFKHLNKKITIPILIVQHMPPMFTQKLAELLNKNEYNEIYEAKEGDVLKAGVSYIAPGDYHMTLLEDNTVSLNQDEKVCFVRPAVDVLLYSIDKNFKGQILNIILTGMGEDGTKGTEALSKSGSYNFIQNEESSVVWGMPGAVARSGVKYKALSLEEIAELILKVSERI